MRGISMLIHGSSQQSANYSQDKTFLESKRFTYEEVESSTVDLLKLAERRIEWSTGLYMISRSAKIAETLQSKAKSLSDAFGQSRVLILLDPERTNAEQARRDVPWLFELSSQSVVELAQCSYPIPHWLLVDNRGIRLEKNHMPGTHPARNLFWKSTPESDGLMSRYALPPIRGCMDRFHEDSMPVSPRK